MSSAPSFVTPLRYPGGKGRLGAWLAELIKHNHLEDSCYVEPYAGGAGAAVFLLVNDLINEIVINDIDPLIYAFWWSIVNEADRLIDLIYTTPVTMEVWHQQREIIASKSHVDMVQLGFSTFFLNRTNRSGIIAGGVIGGQQQTGKYLLDARYNKDKLVERIRRIAKLKDRIKIFNKDALVLISDEGLISSRAIVYLDPPYYEKGSQLYRNHYQPEDHEMIAQAVKKLNNPWLVTYDNCKEIKGLYSDSNGVEFSLHYSTHISRPKKTEAMFYGNLEIHQPPWLRR